MNGFIYDFVLRPFELAGLAQLRAQLLAHAQGKILEIGSGTGINLPYYPRPSDVIGIEPDPSMLKKSIKRAHHFHARMMSGDAMSLPFKDEEFDTVVATLVFCTIPHPEEAIREVYRVLKPGGHFLLLEHVKMNNPALGKLQDLVTPVWKHLAGGCHLNRDPSPLLESNDFKIEEYRLIWQGLGKYWVLKK